MVLNGALRGAGDTRAGLIGTVVGRWLVVVPLAWLLGVVAAWGTSGCGGRSSSASPCRPLWVALRWRRGRWLDVALRRSPVWRSHLHRLDEAERAPSSTACARRRWRTRAPASSSSAGRVRYERDGRRGGALAPSPTSEGPAGP
jgi:hypothetical protein